MKKNAPDTNFLNVNILALIVLNLIALVKFYKLNQEKKKKYQSLIVYFLFFFDYIWEINISIFFVDILISLFCSTRQYTNVLLEWLYVMKKM